MSAEWDKVLKRAEDICVGCGRNLRTGESVTTLDPDAAGFRRQDWCLPCFESGSTKAFSFWKRHGLKGQPRRRLDIAYLCELFKRLDERTDVPSLRLRWIAALLLLRKRLVEEVGREIHNGQEHLVLRLRKEDRIFKVADPGMDADAMSAIEEDLARMFELNGAQ